MNTRFGPLVPTLSDLYQGKARPCWQNRKRSNAAQLTFLQGRIAGQLAIVQMIAVAITLSGSALRTALLATGRQLAVLKVVLVSTLMFHATALTMIPLIGAMGANIANVVMGTVGLVGLLRVYHVAVAAPPQGAPSPASLGNEEPG